MGAQEPHLLSAIITVAARDLPQGEVILRTCSSYMHQLVSEIIAGKKCDVEAVEALLLLAEWEPQDSLSEGKEVGCGEEDRAAWMHVGLALRIGYFLGLDRTAIKHDDEDKAAHFNRRRVTWAGMIPTLSCSSVANFEKLVIYQIDNCPLELAEPFGLEVLLHLRAWEDMEGSSTIFVRFSHRLPKRQITLVFCKQIWISHSCSVMFMMFCTRGWEAA